jgi:hypothetical protein
MIDQKTMDAKPFCVSEVGWGAYTGSELERAVGPFKSSCGPVSFFEFFAAIRPDLALQQKPELAGLTYPRRPLAQRKIRRAPLRQRPRPDLTWQGFQGGPHGLA